jgi:hypothetical protein
MYENDRKQVVKYVTGEAGGTPYTFDLHFMSSNPAAYRQLKADSLLIPPIQEIEQQINGRTSYHIIPKCRIDTLAAGIHNGDVVGFVTSVKGLDFSHVGIIARTGEELTFIHASSLAMEVIVNKEPLKQYAGNSKSCLGIMLARPLPPPTGTIQTQISVQCSDSCICRNLQKEQY